MSEPETKPLLQRVKALMLSDVFFCIFLFISLVVTGMFWTVPSSLVDEIKANVNQDNKAFGYLVSLLRGGKFLGHLGYILLEKLLNPKGYVNLHVTNVIMFTVASLLTPACTRWYYLGPNWLFIGVFLGLMESNIFSINFYINGSKANKFTNITYFCFSLGSSVTPLIVKMLKRDGENGDGCQPQLEITLSVITMGALALVILTLLLILIITRRCKNIYIQQQEAMKNIDEAILTNYKRPYISITALVLCGIFFMAGRTIMETFLLLFAFDARANMSRYHSYGVILAMFTTIMVFRVGLVILPWFFSRAAVVMVAFNCFLFLTIISFLIFRDESRFGILISVVLFGITMAGYQSSLFNWLISIIKMTPVTSAPLLVSTPLGSIITPAVVPHIILAEDGSIDTSRFVYTLTFCFAVALVSCIVLMLSEGSPKKTNLVEQVLLVSEDVSQDKTIMMEDFSEDQASARWSEVKSVDTRDELAPPTRIDVLTPSLCFSPF